MQKVRKAEFLQVQRLLENFGLEVPPETIERYTSVLKALTVQKEDMTDIIGGIFEEPGLEGMIIEGNIPTYSYCEHHILPWFGFTYIGYIAHGKVLGLSKFTRLVNYHCSGLTVQERVCKKISDFLVQFISPDIIVVIQALHTCKVARGVENPFSKSTTIEARGLFREKEGPRLEFFYSIEKIGSL